jgi:heme/copper-type cytochrome/quinol oxidase subunit 1
VLGSRGMPRSHANYTEQLTTLHRIVAVGGVLLVVGVIALTLSVRRAPPTLASPTAFD